MPPGVDFRTYLDQRVSLQDLEIQRYLQNANCDDINRLTALVQHTSKTPYKTLRIYIHQVSWHTQESLYFNVDNSGYDEVSD